MCKCGCNTCDDNKAPIIKEEKKGLLSEGLKYHLDYNIPLSENIYRIGSEEYCKLFVMLVFSSLVLFRLLLPEELKLIDPSKNFSPKTVSKL